MTFSLANRLLHRELRDPYLHTHSKDASGRLTNVRGFYGDRRWVEDLDIVNELGGHTGCVNALSWSKSGRLLASGSDDTHLNIHTYQAENLAQPFTLSTTIATGHSANIFSVKFMPHSNDSTLVSCAGDHQVRIFDIEHSGRGSSPTHITSSSARHHSGINLAELYRGVQFLGPSNTNARTYRSHGGRVKRIITESSPHLFLTCSEDGEVRQWDLRLPSSAYPSPRDFHSSRSTQSHIPPPLISYKRFRLDLNTISCSSSQPHYIVLGGAHLHAFLHDRRMLGRDVNAERGTPTRSAGSLSEAEDELMSKATRCVRRFAPNGKKMMNRTDNGHITACKISDANPNEMIGSWSGDHIYAFNIITSPDAREGRSEKTSVLSSNGKARGVGTNGRKRKRTQDAGAQSSSLSMEGSQRGSARHRHSPTGEVGEIALRVRYGNGQSEDIRLEHSPDSASQARETTLPRVQRRCIRIAKNVSKIRQLLFSPDSEAGAHAQSTTSNSLQDNVRPFSDALTRASIILPEMEDVSSSWSYPLLPDAEIVTIQNTMRRNRAASCRFVQAAGALASVLGGIIDAQELDIPETALTRFRLVEHDVRTGPDFTFGSTYQRFCYLFLASILAWLDGGTAGLLTWFKSKGSSSGQFSVQQNDGEEAIHDKIIPGLLSLANEQERAIVNVDAGRFEVDENRVLFSRGAEAVTAFSHAVRIAPGENMSALSPTPNSDATTSIPAGLAVQQRDTALRYWAFKVGRGLLLSAGEGINYAFVNRAFGGSRMSSRVSAGRNHQDVDPDESEEPVEHIGILSSSLGRPGHMNLESDREIGSQVSVGAVSRSSLSTSATIDDETVAARDMLTALHEHGLETSDSDDGDGMFEGDDIRHSLLSDEVAEVIDLSSGEDPMEEWGHEINEEEDEEDEEDGEDDEVADEEDDSGDSEANFDPRIIFANASSLGNGRESVEVDVSCSSHTRVYRGHCNVETVKDVNFFGQEDEYVVSGSDSGHLFIWDRKTGGLLNILQGDQNVVNVITGHPYEPLLAASGIDHTIKIFSPDQRAQSEARRGINLSTANNYSHGTSSVMRRRPRPSVRAASTDDADTGTTAPGNDAVPVLFADEENTERERASNGGLESCRRLHESYQITSQNDLDRQGGMEDPLLTRSMLAHFAAHIRARRMRSAAPGDEFGDGTVEEDDETVLTDENCTIM